MCTVVNRVERHRKRRNGRVQIQQLSDSAARLVQTAPAGIHELFPPGQGTWDEFTAKLSDLGSSSLPQLADMCKLVER
eukprot:4018114-Pyramimonas_sp.AAC.1